MTGVSHVDRVMALRARIREANPALRKASAPTHFRPLLTQLARNRNRAKAPTAPHDETNLLIRSKLSSAYRHIRNMPV